MQPTPTDVAIRLRSRATGFAPGEIDATYINEPRYVGRLEDNARMVVTYGVLLRLGDPTLGVSVFPRDGEMYIEEVLRAATVGDLA